MQCVPCCIYDTFPTDGPLGLSIRKILFPVQRVAKIEGSRAAANSFFFTLFFFFFSIKILSIFFGGGGGGGGGGESKNEKKSLQPQLFEPSGRSTGNRIIFMDSLDLP